MAGSNKTDEETDAVPTGAVNSALVTAAAAVVPAVPADPAAPALPVAPLAPAAAAPIAPLGNPADGAAPIVPPVVTASEGPTPNERRTLLMTAWEKTVEVQQHFNQLEMEIRRFAITVVVATIGAAGVVAKDSLFLTLCGARVSIASVLVLTGAVAWIAFGTVDYHWYHRLLKGAVKHGEHLELLLQKDGIDVRLATTVTEASKHPNGRGPNSNEKLQRFYVSIFLVLLAMSFVLAWGLA